MKLRDALILTLLALLLGLEFESGCIDVSLAQSSESASIEIDGELDGEESGASGGEIAALESGSELHPLSSTPNIAEGTFARLEALSLVTPSRAPPVNEAFIIAAS